jgi:FkbM family methyltransferase
MKQALGWYWPDDERHLLDWMSTAKPPVLNGRLAYQGTKQQAALKHCKQFRTAVDVGAHIGLWSFNLAHAFAHVHAFEPVSLHRACFALNTSGLTNITMHECALGALPGRVSIRSAPGSSGDSSVAPGDDIVMRRLDDFDLQDVDLIKVDCEGFEENVLVGGCDTLLKWRPTVIVEQKRDMASRFGLKPQGAVTMLKGMGWKVAQELSGDYVMVYP